MEVEGWDSRRLLCTGFKVSNKELAAFMVNQSERWLSLDFRGHSAWGEERIDSDHVFPFIKSRIASIVQVGHTSDHICLFREWSIGQSMGIAWQPLASIYNIEWSHSLVPLGATGRKWWLTMKELCIIWKCLRVNNLILIQCPHNASSACASVFSWQVITKEQKCLS